MRIPVVNLGRGGLGQRAEVPSGEYLKKQQDWLDAKQSEDFACSRAEQFRERARQGELLFAESPQAVQTYKDAAANFGRLCGIYRARAAELRTWLDTHTYGFPPIEIPPIEPAPTPPTDVRALPPVPSIDVRRLQPTVEETPIPAPTEEPMGGPVETPGFAQAGCPPDQILDPNTGQCVPQPVATGYRPGFPGGIISAGLTLGPGAIAAPMLGYYRIMNLR